MNKKDSPVGFARYGDMAQASDEDIQRWLAQRGDVTTSVNSAMKILEHRATVSHAQSMNKWTMWIAMATIVNVLVTVANVIVTMAHR